MERGQMFERFRRYGDTAKKQLDADLSSSEEDKDRFVSELLDREWAELKMKAREGAGREEVDELIGEELEEGAGTSELTQQKIFEIQKEKQMIMLKLKERIRAITNGERTPEAERPGSRRVTYRDGYYFWQPEEGGQEVRLTLGKIIADIGWGGRYILDPETCPQTDQKFYAVEEAKSEILELLDKQIRRQVSGQLERSERRLSFKSNNKRVRKAIETGDIDYTAIGLIAEQIAFSYLKMVSIDYQAGFRVEPVDIYQDAVQKIDFILRVPKSKEERDGGHVVNRIGVQFTTSEERVHGKREQIEALEGEEAHAEVGVDEIVVVAVPMHVRSLVSSWKKDGQPPGGPGQYLSASDRLEMFTKIVGPHISKEKRLQVIGDMYR